MVANGCFLDEAFGEIKTQETYSKEKKKKKKEKGPIEFDRNYNNSSKQVEGYIEDEDTFFEIEQKKQQEKVVREQIENLKKEDFNDDGKNSEYRKLLANKDYQDYLNYQKNRANYINNVQTIEGFANINDNFNDVLLFGLLGIFFLIFTDYIYNLGKKSY